MSYVSEKVKNQFESLPIELKNDILGMNVTLNDMPDLMKVLQDIVNEGEKK